MTDTELSSWLDQLVETLGADPVSTSFGDEEAVVAVAIGKKAQNFKIAAGTINPVGDSEAAVRIPLTKKQLEAVLDGSLSLSEAYMRGDIKPEGSTRALLMAIEIFDGSARGN